MKSGNSMDDREFCRITAAMDGEAATIRNIGRQVKVSEMELVVLCNLAHLQCIQDLARDTSEQEYIDQARDFEEQVRKRFATSNSDGMTKLTVSCIAMIATDKFRRYVIGGTKPRRK